MKKASEPTSNSLGVRQELGGLLVTCQWRWCSLASIRERRGIICGLTEGRHRPTQR